MMKPRSSEWTRLEYPDDSALTLAPVRWTFGVADPEVQYDFGTGQKYLKVALKVGCPDEFVWKIPDIEGKIKQMQMGTTTAVYSVPFHIREFGYKMCTRLGLSGLGSKSHISLYIVMMKGERPFLEKVTMMMLDKEMNGIHILQSFQLNRWPFGSPKFAPLSILKDPRYVKKKTMQCTYKLL